MSHRKLFTFYEFYDFYNFLWDVEVIHQTFGESFQERNWNIYIFVRIPHECMPS